MVVLQLLGTPGLTRDGSRVTGPAVQRHRLALLALLALSGSRPMPRDRLMALLWPERDDEHVRNLLKQSVYVLRRALGDTAIQSVGDALQFDANAVHCDVIEFEQAIAAGDFETALQRYTGPFLDGFFLDGAHEFQSWSEAQRTRLADAHASALETLGQAAEAQLDPRAAMQWWKTLARHDPLNSAAVLGVMRALEATGDPAGALQQAESHARLLREELGIRPPAELAAMVGRLQGLTSEAATGETVTATGPELSWAKPRSRLATNSWRLFATAGALAAVVVLALQFRSEPVAESADRGTQNIAAYELYVRGSDPAMLRSPESARQAMESFQQAVNLDPSYAAAWAGLARLAMRVAFDGDEQRLLALSEQAARKAVELDESLADANATMGLLRLKAFDLPAAENWIRRAVELDPSQASPREWLVGIYLWTDRPALALAEAERAVELDPLSPSASAELARALAANGRCGEALTRLAPLFEVEPPLLRVPLIAAQCYAQRGKWQRAIVELQGESRGGGSMMQQAFIAYATARAGRIDEAQDLRETYLDEWRRDGSSALSLAMLHAGLGDNGEAFAWLERSYMTGQLWATPDVFTLLQPVLEQLRGDTRFERLPMLAPWRLPRDADSVALTESFR